MLRDYLYWLPSATKHFHCWLSLIIHAYSIHNPFKSPNLLSEGFQTFSRKSHEPWEEIWQGRERGSSENAGTLSGWLRCHYFTGRWGTLVEGQKGWPCQSLSTSRINHQNFDLILISKKQKLKKRSHLHIWRTKKHNSLPWHKETTTHNGILTLGVTICTNVKKFVIKHSDGENCSTDWKNEARQLQSEFHREVNMINAFCFNSYFILTN